MIDLQTAATLATAAVGGVLLGVFYFGGLWWTIQRLSRVTRPHTLYFVSLALRLTLVLSAFFGLAMWGPGPLVAGFLGFLAIRLVAVFRARSGATRSESVRSASPSTLAPVTKRV